MERRRLLQLAALGAGGTVGAEALRRFADLAMTAEPRDINEWQVACADHLYALRKRPPAQVRDDLLYDLLTVRRQADQAHGRHKADLHRVTAALSILYINILTRLADHGAAVRWGRTATAAADASGDLSLRVLVRESVGGSGLYGQRHPATVLALLDQADHLAGSAVAAGTSGTRAKALSLLGRHDEALIALNTYVDHDTGPSPDLIPTYRLPDQVHFAGSWVYAASGDERRADESRAQVLSLTPDYQYTANVQLHEALCTVVQGGTEKGARQAAEVLAALPNAYRTNMITEVGRTVLRNVPIDHRDRSPVKDLAALVTTTPALPPAAI
ncbi:hypothetical protein [Thermomonospora umbrina]|nr:hypothetical protein [Thermomonospora umbrina]